MFASMRERLLDQIEVLALFELHNSSQSESWLSSLAGSVAQRVHVEVNGVHIRLEASLSNPFVLGLYVEKATLSGDTRLLDLKGVSVYFSDSGAGPLESLLVYSPHTYSHAELNELLSRRCESHLVAPVDISLLLKEEATELRVSVNVVELQTRCSVSVLRSLVEVYKLYRMHADQLMHQANANLWGILRPPFPVAGHSGAWFRYASQCISLTSRVRSGALPLSALFPWAYSPCEHLWALPSVPLHGAAWALSRAKARTEQYIQLVVEERTDSDEIRYLKASLPLPILLKAHIVAVARRFRQQKTSSRRTWWWGHSKEALSEDVWFDAQEAPDEWFDALDDVDTLSPALQSVLQSMIPNLHHSTSAKFAGSALTLSVNVSCIKVDFITAKSSVTLNMQLLSLLLEPEQLRTTLAGVAVSIKEDGEHLSILSSPSYRAVEVASTDAGVRLDVEPLAVNLTSASLHALSEMVAAVFQDAETLVTAGNGGSDVTGFSEMRSTRSVSDVRSARGVPRWAVAPITVNMASLEVTFPGHPMAVSKGPTCRLSLGVFRARVEASSPTQSLWLHQGLSLIITPLVKAEACLGSLRLAVTQPVLEISQVTASTLTVHCPWRSPLKAATDSVRYFVEVSISETSSRLNFSDLYAVLRGLQWLRLLVPPTSLESSSTERGGHIFDDLAFSALPGAIRQGCPTLGALWVRNPTQPFLALGPKVTVALSVTKLAVRLPVVDAAVPAWSAPVSSRGLLHGSHPHTPSAESSYAYLYADVANASLLFRDWHPLFSSLQMHLPNVTVLSPGSQIVAASPDPLEVEVRLAGHEGCGMLQGAMIWLDLLIPTILSNFQPLLISEIFRLLTLPLPEDISPPASLSIDSYPALDPRRMALADSSEVKLRLRIADASVVAIQSAGSAPIASVRVSGLEASLDVRRFSVYLSFWFDGLRALHESKDVTPLRVHSDGRWGGDLVFIPYYSAFNTGRSLAVDVKVPSLDVVFFMPHVLEIILWVLLEFIPAFIPDPHSLCILDDFTDTDVHVPVRLDSAINTAHLELSKLLLPLRDWRPEVAEFLASGRRFCDGSHTLNTVTIKRLVAEMDLAMHDYSLTLEPSRVSVSGLPFELSKGLRLKTELSQPAGPRRVLMLSLPEVVLPDSLHAALEVHLGLSATSHTADLPVEARVLVQEARITGNVDRVRQIVEAVLDSVLVFNDPEAEVKEPSKAEGGPEQLISLELFVDNAECYLTSPGPVSLQLGKLKLLADLFTDDSFTCAGQLGWCQVEGVGDLSMQLGQRTAGPVFQAARLPQESLLDRCLAPLLLQQRPELEAYDTCSRLSYSTYSGLNLRVDQTVAFALSHATVDALSALRDADSSLGQTSLRMDVDIGLAAVRLQVHGSVPGHFEIALSCFDAKGSWPDAVASSTRDIYVGIADKYSSRQLMTLPCADVAWKNEKFSVMLDSMQVELVSSDLPWIRALIVDWSPVTITDDTQHTIPRASLSSHDTSDSEPTMEKLATTMSGNYQGVEVCYRSVDSLPDAASETRLPAAGIFACLPRLALEIRDLKVLLAADSRDVLHTVREGMAIPFVIMSMEPTDGASGCSISCSSDGLTFKAPLCRLTGKRKGLTDHLVDSLALDVNVSRYGDPQLLLSSLNAAASISALCSSVLMLRIFFNSSHLRDAVASRIQKEDCVLVRNSSGQRMVLDFSKGVPQALPRASSVPLPSPSGQEARLKVSTEFASDCIVWSPRILDGPTHLPGLGLMLEPSLSPGILLLEVKEPVRLTTALPSYTLPTGRLLRQGCFLPRRAGTTQPVDGEVVTMSLSEALQGNLWTVDVVEAFVVTSNLPFVVKMEVVKSPVRVDFIGDDGSLEYSELGSALAIEVMELLPGARVVLSPLTSQIALSLFLEGGVAGSRRLVFSSASPADCESLLIPLFWKTSSVNVVAVKTNPFEIKLSMSYVRVDCVSVLQFPPVEFSTLEEGLEFGDYVIRPLQPDCPVLELVCQGEVQTIHLMEDSHGSCGPLSWFLDQVGLSERFVAVHIEPRFTIVNHTSQEVVVDGLPLPPASRVHCWPPQPWSLRLPDSAVAVRFGHLVSGPLLCPPCSLIWCETSLNKAVLEEMTHLGERAGRLLIEKRVDVPVMAIQEGCTVPVPLSGAEWGWQDLTSDLYLRFFTDIDCTPPVQPSALTASGSSSFPIVSQYVLKSPSGDLVILVRCEPPAYARTTVFVVRRSDYAALLDELSGEVASPLLPFGSLTLTMNATIGIFAEGPAYRVPQHIATLVVSKLVARLGQNSQNTISVSLEAERLRVFDPKAFISPKLCPTGGSEFPAMLDIQRRKRIALQLEAQVMISAHTPAEDEDSLAVLFKSVTVVVGPVNVNLDLRVLLEMASLLRNEVPSFNTEASRGGTLVGVVAVRLDASPMRVSFRPSLPSSSELIGALSEVHSWPVEALHFSSSMGSIVPLRKLPVVGEQILEKLKVSDGKRFHAGLSGLGGQTSVRFHALLGSFRGASSARIRPP